MAEELAAEKVLATPLADAAREGFRITVRTDWNISESMIGSWPPGFFASSLRDEHRTAVVVPRGGCFKEEGRGVGARNFVRHAHLG